MKLTKKELLSSLRKNLNEMPMTFDTPDSRPHPDVERDLANREHPLKKVPFPKDTDAPHSNFEEMLASSRYQQIVANVREYMGLPLGTGEQNIRTLYDTMRDGQIEIQQIESRHKRRLEQLAIELVMEQLGVMEGDINYEATIEMPSSGGFKNTPPGEMEPEEIEIEKELFDEFEDFTLERAKRRLINAMLQGASSKGHYMYFHARNKLQEITGSPNIIGLYGAIMSAAEAMLWQGGNRGLGLSGGGGTPMAGGKERAYPNENPPRVVATAINFPILVHELVKGTMEVIAALHGQPEDKEMARRVMDIEDTKQKEIWDLRLGPAIWDRLKDSFPDETITNEDKVGIQLVFFQHIVSKPAKEFLVFMKEAMTSSVVGKRLMKDLYDMINGEINDYEYEGAMTDFNKQLNIATENTEQDDLYDFLSGLGIDKPKD